MQSLMRLGMCAVASTACCAAVSAGDVAIQDLYSVIPPPTAVVVASKQSDPVPYVIAPQGKSLDQTMCQDVDSDLLGFGEEVAPNTLLIRRVPLPKQLGGKDLVDVFGIEKATKIVPQLIAKPAHGRVELKTFGQWQYYPDKGFKGKDQATFRVDTPKGSYRVVVNLLVGAYNEYAKTPACATQFNMKNSALPDRLVSDYSAWQRAANLSAILANASQSLTSFADLPATAKQRGQVLHCNKSPAHVLNIAQQRNCPSPRQHEPDHQSVSNCLVHFS